MKMILILSIACLMHLVPVQPDISEKVIVQFKIANAGFDVKGSLDIVKAEIKFDPRNLKESHIHAVADPASIQTGISVRDKHLRRSDYFDVSRYPQIILKSTGITKNGRLNYIGEFDLTIKGITKSITILFTLKQQNDLSTYNATFEVNRLDFELGESSTLLDNTVTISVQVQETIQ